jgi:hypothetical protein
MSNPSEPAGWPAPRRLLPVAASRPVRALARGAASITAWARLVNGPLRLGGADVAAPLDRQTRALLWPVLSDIITTIGGLDAADGPVATGLAALTALAERLRDRVTTAPPPAATLSDGAAPPHFFVLEILTRDLQPCLSRWQKRLGDWGDTGQPFVEWPLEPLCRADLARTRDRLIERIWQLGMDLGLSGLDRLAPERPPVPPALVAADELAAAAAAAIERPDPALLQAGWQIYVEAAIRLPAATMPSGPGALGAAIGALDALAAATGAALKTMPPPRPNRAADTVPLLAFGLLTEALQPFLAAWQPRYRRFAATARPEAKWRRAGECRSAIAAARARILPMIEMLGVAIGAPPLAPPLAAVAAEEDAPPLQLPPPATRP